MHGSHDRTHRVTYTLWYTVYGLNYCLPLFIIFTVLNLKNALALLLQLTSNANASGIMIQPSIPVQIVQIVVAMFVMDTWQ